ncbi:MAG: GNAT family N-acetyltransferase [Flavobacteriia bacterium]|jgi:N-acetylglutamate synthase-like GNAT family acetyltransferase|nr:MAG: GNAT family N-acetyltransferase [Flavobacteriia bacterium]
MIRSPQNQTEWKAYFELRFDILRAPWGQAKGSEQTTDEAQHQHFAFFNDANQIIGVGRLDQTAPKVGQVRFMAVAANQQGKGIGKAIMDEIQAVCKAQGCLQIILHAREVALPFYQKLGYQLVEPSHLLFGEIQHYLMQKTLDA